MKKIMIIGITGMLGSTLLRRLVLEKNFDIYGTSRKPSPIEIHKHLKYNHIAEIDVLDEAKLFNLITEIQPDIIINCAGIIKQLDHLNDPLEILPINSLFPHKLNKYCISSNIKLIHISTDCVFSGKKGNYTESDISDAEDLYGKSKFIGELNNKTSLTIRTSIIGHENVTKLSLLEWFLSQEDQIEGYRKAIFSGLTTLELSNVITEIIKNHTNLVGLYNVASEPVSKYDLLNLIAEIYSKEIKITPVDNPEIDRSLNPKKFIDETGIRILSWHNMISSMKLFG